MTPLEVMMAEGLRAKVTETVQQKTVVPGDGETFPRTGDTVLVHYTGRLKDGTIFDSSVDRHSPLRFTVGQYKVIKGWEIAILNMSVGQKDVVQIPCDLAYGARRAGPIPEYSDLEFEMQLVAVGKTDIRFFEGGEWRWKKSERAFYPPKEASEEEREFREEDLMDSDSADEFDSPPPKRSISFDSPPETNGVCGEMKNSDKRQSEVVFELVQQDDAVQIVMVVPDSLTSMEDVDLDMMESGLSLTGRGIKSIQVDFGSEHLELDHTKAKAKFSRRKHTLTVTVPKAAKEAHGSNETNTAELSESKDDYSKEGEQDTGDFEAREDKFYTSNFAARERSQAYIKKEQEKREKALEGQGISSQMMKDWIKEHQQMIDEGGVPKR